MSLPPARGVVEATFQLFKDYSTQAAQLPTGEDFDYHSAFRGFGRRLKEDEAVLMQCMDLCCRQVPKKRRLAAPIASMRPEQQNEYIMEAVDSLLENVDHLLDASRGQRLHGEQQLQLTFGSTLSPAGGGSGGGASSHPASTMVRPQLTFEFPVDNSLSPFRPLLFRKQESVGGSGYLLTFGTAGVHPYANLIKSFAYNTKQLSQPQDQPFVPLATCPLHFIDDVESLAGLAALLTTVEEFAVDLEHHDFFSYQGFTCLMQLSTRTDDYIVDCIRLRSHMHLLNASFLDPKIVKVFHGAKEDIRWLQKDFGLYVANLFDTGLALQTLHMPHGLAFAVDHFCQVKLDKRYQTADWRIRPIPAEMVHYARQDTHYLLYCYDRLRAILYNRDVHVVSGNLLMKVFDDSRALCLTQYEKPEFDPESTYKVAMGRSLGGLSKLQMDVLKAIFNWRDAAAREEDESPPSVMHASAVLQVASRLPTTAKDMLKCCAPVSVVVRKHVLDLVAIVEGVKVAHGATVENDSSTLGSAASASLSSTLHSQSSGGVSMVLRTFQPLTGTLPSTGLWNGADDIEEDEEEDSESLLRYSIASSMMPSAWFASMKSHAAVVAQQKPTVVRLVGQDTIDRAAAPPPAAPLKRQLLKPISSEVTLGKSGNSELGESVTFSRVSAEDGGEGDDASQPTDHPSSAPQQEGVAESNDDDGVDHGMATTAQESLWEDKKALSMAETFGTGRSNRRKQQQQQQQKRARDE